MAEDTGEKLELAKAYVQIVPSMKGIQDNITEALGGAGDIGESAGNALGEGLSDAFSKCMDFVKSSIETGMGFDSAMSQVAATMGQTVGEVSELRDFAKEMGASTAFSATQAAEGLNFMALAGYDAEKSMSMLPDVLNLAAAGNMALGTASDMVTDAQSALGLSMEETTELVDKMAKTSSKSNTSVSQLGEAMLQIGGTAKHLKGGTTELAATLGILADNGMKGAEGGTHLRNMLNSLMSPTKDAQAMLDELGISLYDSEGNMRSLNDVFLDFRSVLNGMETDAEKDSVFTTIFNARDMKAAEALVAGVGDRFNVLSGYIDDSAGAAKAMAETQLDNLAGDVTLMQSAFEGLQIEISDKLTPDLRRLVQAATDGLEWASDHVNTLIGTAKALGVAVTAIKLPKLIGEAKAAMTAFNAVCANNQLLVVGAAAVSAAMLAKGVIDDLTDSIDETNGAYQILNSTQEQTISDVSALAQASRELSDTHAGNIDAVEHEGDVVQNLAKKMFELNETEELSNAQKETMAAYVEKLNSSVSGLNLELDEETGHLKNQKQAVDELIKSWLNEEKIKEYHSQIIDLTAQQTEAEEVLKEATLERQGAYNTLGQKQLELASMQRELNELNAKETWTKEENDRYYELTQSINQTTRAINDQKEKLGDINAAYVTVSETSKSLDAEVNKVTNDLEKLTGGSEEASEAVLQTAESAEQTADAFVNAEGGFDHFAAVVNGELVELNEANAAYVAQALDNYDTLYEKQKQAIENSVDLFKEFDLTYETTYQDMYTAAESNAKALDIWKSHVETLQKKVDEGIMSEQLLEDLKAMGLGSLDEMDVLVHGTDTKLKSYSDKWQEAYDLQTSATDTAMAKLKKTTENELNNMLGITSAKLEDYKDTMEDLGIAGHDGFVKGLSSKIDEIEKAAKKGISDPTLYTLTEELDTGSPSKKTQELGEWTGEGFATGIEKTEGIVGTAAHNMAVNVLNEVVKTMSISSPSKAMAELGKFVSLGFAGGINDEADEAVRAAEKMAGNVLDTMNADRDIFRFDFDDPSAALSLAAERRSENYTPSPSYSADGSQNGSKQPIAINLYLSPGDSRPIAQWIVNDLNDILGEMTVLANRGLA